jgi:hypothetical protein
MLFEYIVYVVGVSSLISSLFYLIKIDHNSEIIKSYQKLELLKHKTDDAVKIKEIEQLQDKLLKTPAFS